MKVTFDVQIQNLFLNTVIALSIHFFYIFFWQNTRRLFGSEIIRNFLFAGGSRWQDGFCPREIIRIQQATLQLRDLKLLSLLLNQVGGRQFTQVHELLRRRPP